MSETRDALDASKTTSRDTVKLVENYYSTVDREPENVHFLFSEDSVYFRPGYQPIRGRECVKRFYRESRIIASGQHRVTEVLPVAERIAVAGTFSGFATDGAAICLDFADFFTFSDDLITERTTYFHVPAV